MGDFTMPSLGADMERGRLAEWRVAVGDHVTKGDIVAVVETDKSDVDVEVFETGVVEELLIEPGTEVEVGTPLARIGTGTAQTAPAPPAPSALSGATPAPSGGRGHRHASVVLSPLVRHRAEELAVDLRATRGTGVGGRITRDDVEHARPDHPTVPPTRPQPRAQPRVQPGGRPETHRASPAARRRATELGIDLDAVAGSVLDGRVHLRDLDAAPPPVPSPPRDRQATMRAAIARLMTTANQEIPHYHVLSTIDVHDALAWLEHRNAAVPPGERILPAALLLHATALAFARTPELNGWWRNDRFEPAAGVDLGVAVSLRGGGVVTPTIGGLEALDLPATMAALREVVARARRGNLRAGDVADASATVTNLGEHGAMAVLGVIHPPQVALVGLGRPVETVGVIDGEVTIRTTVTATLSGDHRATDGHAGSRFLAAMEAALAAPDDL